MCARGHADHVDATFLHCAMRRRQVRHPVGVKHRDPERVANALHLVDVRRDRMRHVGHGEAQARVVERGADGDVQKIDEPGVDVQAHDLHGVVFVQALVHELVHGEAHADQETIGRALAHRRERFQSEPGAVGGAPPVAVGTAVHRGGPELAAEVPEHRELAAVEPTLPRAARRGREVADDPLDVVSIHGLGKGSVRGARAPPTARWSGASRASSSRCAAPCG